MPRHRISLHRLLALCSLIALLLSVQATALAASAIAIDDAVRRGSLRVGMSTFVPWAMRDKNGELIGFEIDVARKLAEDLDIEVEFVATAWDGIIPALLASKFDVIIGGMSVTPQRNLTVNFTVPYSNSSLGVMANTKLAEGLHWKDEYNSPKVSFACRRGSTPCAWIADEFPKATLRQFDDEGQVIQEVLNGNAHALVLSQPTPAFTIYDHPDVVFSPTQDKINPGHEAMAVRKGDVDTLNVLNNWIMINRDNGWLEERYQYWFGGRSWADQLAD